MYMGYNNGREMREIIATAKKCWLPVIEICQMETTPPFSQAHDVFVSSDSDFVFDPIKRARTKRCNWVV